MLADSALSLRSRNALSWYISRTKSSIELLAQLSRREKTERSPSYCRSIETLYGRFLGTHAFYSPTLVGGHRLREDYVTKGFRDIFEGANSQCRRRWMTAFLTALGVIEMPTADQIDGCRVFAERDRIDLEFWFPLPQSRWRIIVIEAKFGHLVRVGKAGKKGQLRQYREKRTGQCFSPEFFLLVQSLETADGLHSTQVGLWKTTQWSNLLRALIRETAQDDTPEFNLFLSAVWDKIHHAH